MKNFLLFLLLTAVVWCACKNDGGESVQEIRNAKGPNSSMIRNPVTADLPLDSNQLARIVYTEPEYDFGTVTEGTVVKHDFHFVNSGKVPLTILNARSSCGCTIPEWPEAPIPPGGSGVISARFDTKGREEEQKKLIFITANTYPNETKVLLKGIVAPK